MKHIVAIFLLLSSVGFSQAENDSIYRSADENAQFHGGYSEMIMYIVKHINYPSCLPEGINTRSIV